MKCPAKRILKILKQKLNRYGKPGEYYYGGCLTYYEIKVLVRYFKIKPDKNECLKYYTDLLEKGINGSSWFYFNYKGNERVIKELGLDI